MKLSSIGWNAAGLGAPLLIGLLTIPPLLHTLGNERFGLLSLAWAMTAMAGLFDLGIGRATTRLVAEQLGRGQEVKVRATLSASLRVSAAAGALGGLLLAAAVALGAHHALNFSADLEPEIRVAAYLLALSIPLQTSIATYRGVCEARQQFRGISLVRLMLGVANFGAPLAVAQLTTNMAWLVLALLLTRVLAWSTFRKLAIDALPEGPVASHRLSAEEQRGLLRAGGWFTISAVVSPLLVQADRFFIGAQLSAAAVPTYTVPFDLITQLLIGVTAVSTVAFPSIATELHRNPLTARVTFTRWLRIVTIGMALLTATVAALLPAALSAWVGSALPPEATTVGRWLCLGVWVNSIGVMYFARLHASGWFRATALLHLVELPIYLLALVLLLRHFGIEGAAIAWVARATADTVALAWLGHQRTKTQAYSVS